MGKIREVQFGKPAVNDDLVHVLEEWVERAKDGTIQAVGLVGVKPDGTISTEWTGLGGGWLHQLNSAITILQHRILTANIEPG